MICTICGRDRAKNFTRKTDGREITLTLCSDCYARLYPEQRTDDFLTAFVGRTEGRRGKACPSCGATLEGFRRTGLLGCAECYSAFRAELLPTIRYVQGTTKHEGNAPSAIAEEKYDRLLELVRMQETLKEQIKEAEHVRDEERINALKTQLQDVNRKIYGGEDD